MLFLCLIIAGAICSVVLVASALVRLGLSPQQQPMSPPPPSPPQLYVNLVSTLVIDLGSFLFKLRL